MEMFRKSERDFHFYPENSDKPMETHAKLIVIDDMRVLLTSANFLSFGDTEGVRGDAGELGILVDHPRISRYTRGQMEIWLPHGRNPQDLTRWGAALSEEVTILAHSSFTSVPMEGALGGMMNRILGNGDLLDDWKRTFGGVDSSIIVQRIMNNSWNNGGIIGLVHASGNGANNYRKINAEGTMISLAGDPIWRELSEVEEQHKAKIKAEQRRREKEMIQSYEISPKQFGRELLLRMKDQDKWSTFTSAYAILISEMPQFNLKARGIKPTEYLQECSEMIETEIREGGWWWIRRRR